MVSRAWHRIFNSKFPRFQPCCQFDQCQRIAPYWSDDRSICSRVRLSLQIDYRAGNDECLPTKQRQSDKRGTTSRRDRRDHASLRPIWNIDSDNRALCRPFSSSHRRLETLFQTLADHNEWPHNRSSDRNDREVDEFVIYPYCYISLRLNILKIETYIIIVVGINFRDAKISNVRRNFVPRAFAFVSCVITFDERCVRNLHGCKLEPLDNRNDMD